MVVSVEDGDEFQRPVVFLDDLLDDGEAEARPLGPVGDVGLEGAGPAGRQARAVVLDVDLDPFGVGLEADADLALGQ